MCAIAEGFLGRRTAATERHPFFHLEFAAVSVDQFDFSRNDVRAVLDCFDFYVSHGAILVEVDRVVLNVMSR